MNWKRIAHRGAPLIAKENTIDSFSKAINAGAKWVELDVLLSKDNIPFVFHDFSLHRMIGKRIKAESLMFEELRELCMPRLLIPSLKEVMELFEQNQVKVYLEIKSKNKAIVKEVVEVAESHDVEKVYSSFHHPHLRSIKSMDKNLKTMGLAKYTWNISKKLIERNDIDEVGVSLQGSKSPGMNFFVERNIPVFVYTVNKQEEEDALKIKKASGIFTDTFGKEFLLRN